MFDKEGDEPDEGVQGVKALGSDEAGRVVLLGERAVAQINAHLGWHSEKPENKFLCYKESGDFCYTNLTFLNVYSGVYIVKFDYPPPRAIFLSL